MLQDDSVSPEGDKVMSRGDPEVGQLLGVCYIIHIHKQHPGVAANWLCADCLFCSSGPALRLNVKQPSSAAMLIGAIEADCLVCVPPPPVRGSYAVTFTNECLRVSGSSVENSRMHY